jgi:hypothetical protein
VGWVRVRSEKELRARLRQALSRLPGSARRYVKTWAKEGGVRPFFERVGHAAAFVDVVEDDGIERNAFVPLDGLRDTEILFAAELGGIASAHWLVALVERGYTVRPGLEVGWESDFPAERLACAIGEVSRGRQPTTPLECGFRTIVNAKIGSW